jgi:hypothetical protein
MLESLPPKPPIHEPPRATLLAAPGEMARTGLWMGGAHTTLGEPIAVETLAASWVIDCAGDMPHGYRKAAGRWLAYVFADLESVPGRFERLQHLVAEVAGAMSSANGAAPRDVFVVCQHGMNRSGLVAGLLLRELGLTGEDAVARIVSARPGSLSNQTFRRLLLGSRE